MNETNASLLAGPPSPNPLNINIEFNINNARPTPHDVNQYLSPYAASSEAKKWTTMYSTSKIHVPATSPKHQNLHKPTAKPIPKKWSI